MIEGGISRTHFYGDFLVEHCFINNLSVSEQNYNKHILKKHLLFSFE